MSIYTPASSLETVYAIRDAATAAAQNEVRSTSNNVFVAWLREQFTTTTPFGRGLNGSLIVLIAVLGVAHTIVAADTTVSHHQSITEAPAVWVDDNGPVYAEGEAIIGSAPQGNE